MRGDPRAYALGRLAALFFLRDHDDRALGVPGEPAGNRAGEVVPETPGRADHQGVGAELRRDRGEFACRVPAPGPDVYFQFASVGDVIQFRQQPALKGVSIPQQPDYLAGQWFTVDA